MDSWAGWCKQKELSIPFTEFWNIRGQVAILSHQRQGRCDCCNGQQDQSSYQGALTLRDLWDDWEIILFQAQMIGCYVTCITRKNSVLPSRRLMSATKMESYSFLSKFQMYDTAQIQNPLIEGNVGSPWGRIQQYHY